jgi:hypothetical protein
MFLRFLLANIQSGEVDVSSYIDTNEIASWNTWNVGDQPGPGIHRLMRGKKIVVINMKGGLAHWCIESFDSVAARILEARGNETDAQEARRRHLEAAEIHKNKHADTQLRELNVKHPLAV